MNEEEVKKAVETRMSQFDIAEIWVDSAEEPFVLQDYNDWLFISDSFARRSRARNRFIVEMDALLNPEKSEFLVLTTNANSRIYSGMVDSMTCIYRGGVWLV